MKVRSQTGKEYEPKTLTGISTNTCTITARLEVDMEFKSSRDALAAKWKALRTEGKGLHMNAATAFTAQEEDHLWRAGHLGSVGGM